MQVVRFRAMNTSVLMAAEGQGTVRLGMKAAQDFIEASEKRLSRFLPESELSRLNRSPGMWVDVSADLLDLLQQSLDFWRETDGLFDPSILHDLKRIGYDRSMDEVRARGDLPTPSASTHRLRPGLDKLEFDSARSRVRLPRGLEVDLGGIAKGWIVEKAAQLLGAHTEACAVNAGGDMFFIGHPAEAAKWEVSLEDPRAPESMLTALTVASGAVATSSVRKRAWTQGGQARHHLIDPRTGESAQTEWLSVTVTAPRLATADVFAKVLLIGGTEAVRLLPPNVSYLAVNEAGEMTGSLEPIGEL